MSTLVEMKETFICGGISGLVSNAIMHPMDTLKAQTQFRLSFRLNREVLRTLYRGYSLVLVSTIPTTCVYFLALEQAKKRISSELGPLKEFFSGVCGQTVASLFFTPRDVIKERLQVSGILIFTHRHFPFKLQGKKLEYKI
eukprot:TRINITY_DN1845_c0_g1_i4.p1 TRINITY_DN1845_c0_g1~~TRINITY_DN1845_c0_g1_i4.p1  ORF type:complete len:141 (+),score=23.99 TRINITY_DN1845_c0_g1_i4:77-499(+)